MKLDDLLSMKMAEYNVLVRMDPVEQRTAGGIILTNDAVDRDALSRDVGTLVNVGEHAFSYVNEWKNGAPQPGDRVLIAMYDGKMYDVQGEKFRVIKDKSVVGWWADKPALAAAA